MCVDTDRDRRLGCRHGDTSELFRTGDTIQLDGQAVHVSVTTSGHQVELRPVTHFVSTFPAASHATQQGFVRVINHGDRDGEIEIEAADDEGAMYGPVTLAIGAGQTVHFNSDDLERGNADKGLSGGVGAGVGTWRLELRSGLDVEVLSYIRTVDGFVTNMHDLVIDRAGVYRVPFFNPAQACCASSIRAMAPHRLRSWAWTTRGGGPLRWKSRSLRGPHAPYRRAIRKRVWAWRVRSGTGAASGNCT